MRYVLRLTILGAVGVLLVFAGCQQTPDRETRQIASYPTVGQNEPEVRVLALEAAGAVDLIVPGAYGLSVIDMAGKTVTGGGGSAVTVSVSATPDGIKLGQNLYKKAEVTPRSGEFTLRFLQDKTLVQRTYPGTFVFSRSPSGKLRIIVRVPLEQYLVGVLPGEMPLSFPPEALKAQAVASRTYALYQIRTSENRDYDVYSDVRSQVWRPVQEADPRARMAVNATRGLVLTENFRIFPTYFHADCGPRTANAKFVFSGSDINAMRGRECPFAPQSHPWKFTISKEALATRLANAGVSNGRILRIELLDENQQPLSTIGRVYFVRLLIDNGVVRTVPANTFRLAVGAEKHEMSSTWCFAAHNPNETITFEGRGIGHGVGMCQWGAMHMASEGEDYVDILYYYYSGSKLLRLW